MIEATSLPSSQLAQCVAARVWGLAGFRSVKDSNTLVLWTATTPYLPMLQEKIKIKTNQKQTQLEHQQNMEIKKKQNKKKQHMEPSPCMGPPGNMSGQNCNLPSQKKKHCCFLALWREKQDTAPYSNNYQKFWFGCTQALYTNISWRQGRSLYSP